MNHRPASGTINCSQFDFRGLANEDTRVSTLMLSAGLRETIVAFLRRCLPHEGVGLLAASRTGSSLIAVHFYPGRNMDSSPRRYTMDPTDVMSALADMKRRKTRLGAIVHSHPNTSPVPSFTDLVEARFPSVLSLIVGLSPVVELRAWYLVYDGGGVAVGCEEVLIT
jgi:[CysO sulfur-carrier protein]-S-L-cysteine hydrolase